MQKVYLLIGVPGCGKSTFAKKIDGICVSIDDVRKKLSDCEKIGKKYSSLDNDLVFEEFHKEIKKLASLGKDVIVDSTNARLFEREKIYDLLKEEKPKFIGVYFHTNREVCLERMLKRKRAEVNVFEAPEVALDTYIDRLNNSIPTLKEKLSEIWHIENDELIEKERKKDIDLLNKSWENCNLQTGLRRIRNRNNIFSRNKG